MLVKTQILPAMRKQNPKSLQRNKSDIFYTEEEVTDPGWKWSHHILILFIWGKIEGKAKHREKQLYHSVGTANEVIIGSRVSEITGRTLTKKKKRNPDILLLNKDLQGYTQDISLHYLCASHGAIFTYKFLGLGR